MIKLCEVSKDFKLEASEDKVSVLKNLNLSLQNRGVISICGPSGCGKTTLLSLISLMDVPTSGTIYFDGVDTNLLSEKEKDNFRHFSIGYVFQEYNLVEHLNVIENIKLSFAFGSKKKKQEENQIIEKLMNDTGIYHLRDRKANVLSGGEKQRIAIARALANNPKIILADEPTGSLDEKTATEIMKLFKEISKDKLVIIVSHNEHLMKKFADRIIYLNDGNIEKDITINEIADDDSAKETNSSKEIRMYPPLSLATRRLKGKKGRYAFLGVLNSIAVFSIGIASSAYIGSEIFSNKTQADTLKTFPVAVSSVYIGTGRSFLTSNTKLYPDDGYIHRISDDNSTTGVNSITNDYISYLKDEFIKNGIDESCLTLRKGLAPKILLQGENNQIESFDAKDITTFTGFDSLWKEAANYFTPLYGGIDQLKDSYELVYGNFPTEDNEILVVLDNHDSFPAYMLDMLGLKGDKIQYSVLQNKRFKFVNNDEFYPLVSLGDSVTGKFIKDNETLKSEGKQADEIQELLLKAAIYCQLGGQDNINKMNEYLKTVESYFCDVEETRQLKFFTQQYNLTSLFNDPNIGHEMVISGFVHPKKDQLFPYLQSGFYYSKEYNDLFLQENMNSQFCEEMSQHMTFERENNIITIPDVYEVIDGTEKQKKTGLVDMSKTYNYILNRKLYGVDESVYQIEIIAKNFKMKEKIISILDRWNQQHDETHRLIYSDIGGTIVNLVDKYISILLAVLIVVIAIVIFFSVLVTSLLSILEINSRKKEIGLYRSIGASKSMVKKLFIYEEGMMGVLSGVVGIILTCISIPIFNLFIKNAIKAAVISNFLALRWWMIIFIPIIFIFISIISALIPAIIASNKNPSETLREI